MLKRVISTILLAGLFFLAFTTNVSAHVFKADGPIGAVVHIDPDDDPIVGEPAYFFFDFNDREGKFTPETCSCSVTISSQGTDPFTTLLGTDPSLDASSFSYTFSKKGIYNIKVEGNSIDAGSFQPFTLEYNLRVERESREPSSTTGNFFSNNWETFLLVGIILVFLLILVSGRRKTRQDSSGKSANLILFLTAASLLLHPLAYPGNVDQYQHSNHEENHLSHELHPCCLSITGNIVVGETSTTTEIKVGLVVEVLNQVTTLEQRLPQLRSPPS